MLPALLAVAALAGSAGYMGASARNKKIPSLPSIQPYGGQRPFGVNKSTEYEPVNEQIRNILLKRSQFGNPEIGYGSTWAPNKKEAFRLEQEPKREEANRDIMNQLSGTGMSRNLAARDALLGRTNREFERESNKYGLGVDIAGAEAGRADLNAYTQALQNLRQQYAGQQQSAANFDENVWAAEQGLNQQQFGNELMQYGLYQDPLGTGIETGLSTMGSIGDITSQYGLAEALKKWANQGNTFGGGAGSGQSTVSKYGLSNF